MRVLANSALLVATMLALSFSMQCVPVELMCFGQRYFALSATVSGPPHTPPELERLLRLHAGPANRFCFLHAPGVRDSQVALAKWQQHVPRCRLAHFGLAGRGGMREAPEPQVDKPRDRGTRGETGAIAHVQRLLAETTAREPPTVSE